MEAPLLDARMRFNDTARVAGLYAASKWRRVHERMPVTPVLLTIRTEMLLTSSIAGGPNAPGVSFHIHSFIHSFPRFISQTPLGGITGKISKQASVYRSMNRARITACHLTLAIIVLFAYL